MSLKETLAKGTKAVGDATKQGAQAIGAAAKQSAQTVSEATQKGTEQVVKTTGNTLKNKKTHAVAGVAVEAVVEGAFAVAGRVLVPAAKVSGILLGKNVQSITKQAGRVAAAAQKSIVKNLSGHLAAGLTKAGETLSPTPPGQTKKRTTKPKK